MYQSFTQPVASPLQWQAAGTTGSPGGGAPPGGGTIAYTLNPGALSPGMAAFWGFSFIHGPPDAAAWAGSALVWSGGSLADFVADCVAAMGLPPLFSWSWDGAYVYLEADAAELQAYCAAHWAVPDCNPCGAYVWAARYSGELVPLASIATATVCPSDGSPGPGGDSGGSYDGSGCMTGPCFCLPVAPADQLQLLCGWQQWAVPNGLYPLLLAPQPGSASSYDHSAVGQAVVLGGYAFVQAALPPDLPPGYSFRLAADLSELASQAGCRVLDFATLPDGHSVQRLVWAPCTAEPVYAWCDDYTYLGSIAPAASPSDAATAVAALGLSATASGTRLYICGATPPEGCPDAVLHLLPPFPDCDTLPGATALIPEGFPAALYSSVLCVQPLCHTLLLRCQNNQDGLGYPYSLHPAQAPPAGWYHQQYRLPARLTNPQYTASRRVYRTSSGHTRKLYSTLGHRMTLETDYLPPWVHEAVATALEHDTVALLPEDATGWLTVAAEDDYALTELDAPPEYALRKARTVLTLSPYLRVNDWC